MSAEPFLPNKPLPEGVDQKDLYEGPKVVPLASGRAAMLPPTAQELAPVAGLITPIPAAPVVDTLPVSTEAVKSEYAAVIELALDVLSARLLGLIALVTACLIWAGVIWDPEFWRIIAAGVFSVLVFLPIMVIYWRAGMRGEGA